MAYMRANKDQFMEAMESVPSQVYWGLGLGSIVLSALLFLTGRRETALFVGQWPPTFIALALFYKLLRPSREQGSQGMRQAVEGMTEAMR